MRRLLATWSNVYVLLTGALLGAPLNAIASDLGVSDSPPPAAAAARAPDETACGSEEIVVYEPNASAAVELPCEADQRTSKEAVEGRAYLIETATPGYTMTRQGPELAVERLHPEFVIRLANALREARNEGLPFAGVFSAYRPPAFGVGGFADKFNSLHAYGLAVDMHGIGRPGSPEAQRWHEIAAKHGVVCPYGPRNRAEWNHCQPTRLKIVRAENPLRETISAHGPVSLENMFEVGNTVIASLASAAESVAKDPPASASGQESSDPEVMKLELGAAAKSKAKNTSKQKARLAKTRVGKKAARIARNKVRARVAARKKPVIAAKDGREKSQRRVTMTEVSPRSASRSRARATRENGSRRHRES